jgi:hypothetical protein
MLTDEELIAHATAVQVDGMIALAREKYQASHPGVRAMAGEILKLRAQVAALTGEHTGPCCDCMCAHRHAPDPTLDHVGGPSCIACKWCTCRGRDHSGTCDEQAPCRRCADRAELEWLRAMERRARDMTKYSDGGRTGRQAAHYILGET